MGLVFFSKSLIFSISNFLRRARAKARLLVITFAFNFRVAFLKFFVSLPYYHACNPFCDQSINTDVSKFKLESEHSGPPVKVSLKR